MEAVGFAVAIYTSFKEVYLVAKFMHRTVVSAGSKDAERKELRRRFHVELLFLQSLGQIYLGRNGIMENDQLDERWMNHLYLILERMRLICMDYARIAGEEDREYIEYSPFHNRGKYDTRAIEFDIDSPVQSVSNPKFFSPSGLRWLGIRAKTNLSDSLEGLKWALSEKKRFERVLYEFQDCNQQLKDILPLYTASKLSRRPDLQPQSSNATSPTIARSPDPLGLLPHERLREISANPDTDQTDFLLKNIDLDVSTDSGTVLVGSVSRGRSREAAPVLVEYKEYEVTESIETAEKAHMRAVQQLGSLLKSAGKHELSTLPFVGILEEPDRTRHAFIFEFPRNTSTSDPPISLKNLITSRGISNRLNLPQRFNVARTIAKSIGAFHADGWVHKSIRSDSVLFFKPGAKSDSKLLTDIPYLANFEFSRPETAVTKLSFDDDLERNLYRHPLRQGAPKLSFSKVHDIYSLGVVLLEIGLWQSALSIIKKIRLGVSDENIRPSPQGCKDIFLGMAEERLDFHMGPSYVEAVVACLDGRFENRTSRSDFPMVFHEEVVEKLDMRYLSGSSDRSLALVVPYRRT